MVDMLSEALNDIKSMGDTLTEKQKDVIITHLNDGSLKINC